MGWVLGEVVWGEKGIQLDDDDDIGPLVIAYLTITLHVCLGFEERYWVIGRTWKSPEN